jgi:hypothetical protein
MMTTDDLIMSLSADASPVRSGLLRRGVLAGLGLGGLLAVLGFAAFWGVQPDLGQVLAPFLALKSVLPALLAVIGVPLVLAHARPGGKSRAGSVIWGLPMFLAGLAGLAFVVTPSVDRRAEFLGSSIATCLSSIPMLSAPILAGLLLGLRRGAPEHPARCGAVAGLVAGGAAAALYSLYCTEDSPLFYGTWYVLAIAAVAGLGAIAVRRLLRW